jgi:hypothetical protein
MISSVQLLVMYTGAACSPPLLLWHETSFEVRGYFTTDSQSVSQSVCLGIEHLCGTCEQILLPVGMLLSKICGLVSIGRPL